MKILITGASGFIGSRLVRAACTLYGKNSVLALSSRPQTACETIIYDNRDFRIIQSDLVKIEQVEVLIHAGAYTPKSAANSNAIDQCNGNIFFTTQLLQLPLSNLKRIINLSTIDVYTSVDEIDETTPTVPRTLYGMSKLYCERLVAIFAENRRLACQILRVGHVYGPGEEEYAKFLPRAIQNVVSNMPIELWGDGSELRSFIYIDDVVRAILAAITLPPNIGVINVVGGNAISIRQVLDAIIAISDKKVDIEFHESKGVKQDFVFDNAKCRTHLLLRETDFFDGLRAEYKHIENRC